MSTSAKAALLEEYALVARALSAPARLVILEQLAQGERAVEGVAAKTGLTVANCSQHLQHLRRAGLVTNRRAGKAVIYRLTDPRTLALIDLLRLVAERNLAQVEHILRGLSGSEDAPEPVSRQDLAARLAEGSVTVLDLRPADEYAAGHIPGAVNAMLADLERIIPTLAQGTEIIAYCRGPYCIYAHQAVAALRKRGLNARRMDGGLPEWREDGRMVETVAG
ncbi:ArsR/SmtB family transcription factor [Palleronia sp. KMU-117]|uniref:ArsR/SmtB family transcription factor n=1 Tax=Palleronia sp. KMU-117 TaxID=3434108 RepID=UPI003D729249